MDEEVPRPWTGARPLASWVAAAIVVLSALSLASGTSLVQAPPGTHDGALSGAEEDRTASHAQASRSVADARCEGAGGCVETSGSSTSGWSEVPGPSPAYVGMASAYDPEAGELVFFGGASSISRPYSTGAFSNVTWTFQGGSWTEALLDPSPPPLFDPAMAYNSADGFVLLFGGELAGNAGALLASDQTWAFNGGTWENLTTPGGPPARIAASMAPVEVVATGGGSGVLLFGGEPSPTGETLLNDTWTFTTYWTNVTLTSGRAPPARQGAAMAAEELDGETLLFGGSPCDVGESCEPLNDTWSWDLSWSNPEFGRAGTDQNGPSARVDAQATWDGLNNVLLLFGGANENGIAYNDTWEWTGALWQNLTYASGTAPARAGGAMAYTSQDTMVVLAGGCATSVCAETLPTYAYPAGPLEYVSSWASPSEVEDGQPIYAGMNVSGGLSPITYRWEGASPCSSTSEAGEVECELGPGQYNLQGYASDARGWVVQTPEFSVAVASPLTSSLSATPESGTAPLEEEIEAEASGGWVPYAATVNFGDGTTSVVQTGEIEFHTYDEPGTYEVHLEVTDALGEESSSQTEVVVDDSLEAGTITGAPSTPVLVDQTFTLTDEPYGGVQPYDFHWESADPLTCTPSSIGYEGTLACESSTPGTYQVGLLVTDAAGDSAVAVSVQIVVESSSSPSGGSGSSGGPGWGEVALPYLMAGFLVGVIVVWAFLVHRTRSWPPERLPEASENLGPFEHR